MRRVLILGGTAWLGREIAKAAISDGAEVVCLARGDSGAAPEGTRFVRSDRTKAGAYDSLNGDWDEVIELAYDPELVTSALEAIGGRARHWTLISSVSVYKSNDLPGADESAELVEPLDLRQYPDAKVAAEQATSSRLDAKLLVVRPGLIVGPGDTSDRFCYWPARLHRGGHVLVPQSEDRHVQIIDVTDLAEWIVAAGRAGRTGAVNAVGSSMPLDALLAEMSATVGFDGALVSADDSWLLQQGVQYWAGPRSLPLWLPREDAAFAQRSNDAFMEAGGRLRPVTDTIARVLEDEMIRGLDRPRRSGLNAIEEAELLELLQAERHTTVA